MNGEGHGQFLAGESGLAHPWATYMSPQLFLLLACLISALVRAINKGLFKLAYQPSFTLSWYIFLFSLSPMLVEKQNSLDSVKVTSKKSKITK
jgi:hypothetical protein